METKKGYLVANITQINEPIFKSQIDLFCKCFYDLQINLFIVDNLHAYDVISNNRNVDFVLFWDKDISLAYEIRNLGITIFNNIEALGLCDDKAFTFSFLKRENVNTPKTVILPLTFFEPVTNYFTEIKKKIISAGIKYPFLIKERRSSLGLGVYMVKNDNELLEILKTKGYLGLLAQEYIDYEFGTDYRIYLIDHRPQVVVKRVNKNDFRSNVNRGGTMSVIKKPEKELLNLAIKSSKAVQLDFGAVDIVKNKDGKFLVLEVNSNARTETIDSITRKNITAKIAKYILLKLRP